jgi:membrane protein
MGLGMIYRYGPNRRGEARGPWLTPGVLVAVVIWAVFSWLFSLYISNFNRFNEVYGALGAAIILLLWFYISAYAVLLGAALNAKLERMEARRQHKPTPKPSPPVPEDM